jgi:hypothetical protein
LEERTGRSLSNPRAIAELSLAYEIDCALAASAGNSNSNGTNSAAGTGFSACP